MNIATAQLENRIARLEKVNVFVSIIAIVSIAAILTGATMNSETITATSFQLVNAEGQVQAELATRDGNPGLYVMDEQGVDRVAVFHEADTSGVYVMDSDGVTRIGVAQFSHGGGGFALHGPESKGAAVLYFKNEGSLRFFDAEGRVTNTVMGNQDNRDRAADSKARE